MESNRDGAHSPSLLFDDWDSDFDAEAALLDFELGLLRGGEKMDVDDLDTELDPDPADTNLLDEADTNTTTGTNDAGRKTVLPTFKSSLPGANSIRVGIFNCPVPDEVNLKFRFFRAYTGVASTQFYDKAKATMQLLLHLTASQGTTEFDIYSQFLNLYLQQQGGIWTLGLKPKFTMREMKKAQETMVKLLKGVMTPDTTRQSITQYVYLHYAVNLITRAFSVFSSGMQSLEMDKLLKIITHQKNERLVMTSLKSAFMVFENFALRSAHLFDSVQKEDFSWFFDDCLCITQQEEDEFAGVGIPILKTMSENEKQHGKYLKMYSPQDTILVQLFLGKWRCSYQLGRMISKKGIGKEHGKDDSSSNSNSSSTAASTVSTGGSRVNGKVLVSRLITGKNLALAQSEDDNETHLPEDSTTRDDDGCADDEDLIDGDLESSGQPSETDPTEDSTLWGGFGLTVDEMHLVRSMQQVREIWYQTTDASKRKLILDYLDSMPDRICTEL